MFSRIKCSPSIAALRSGTRLSSSSQPSSLQTATSSSLERDLIVPAENGRIWVAWHPERDVPFEHTKPLDATQKEIRMAEIEAHTALKLPERTLKFRNIRNEVEYLKKLTFTNKHRWFPQPRDKRQTRRPHDRDGL